jgi:hypothetical protein
MILCKETLAVTLPMLKAILITGGTGKQAQAVV